MQTIFPCPRCGEDSTWQNNTFRPFCSERCKLIDLGAWASDAYRLPSEEAPSAHEKNLDD
ncbi:DNA gyrase inhibitor YacG [Acinetobacter sp. B5B]|uniref:DNA gyrase inhibitor YacG n=1 Tax=Acinetobacter baretiae TaxID=2605383 RepID=UPI0018C1DB28|nr:DNA gyrase inhibitor YacG [Acinetobacter baretiae]MBF7682288.1 DNA gyrase inhibitor YacG [Acinetobacter baretiae]MBF7685116.1 DNA gyrase inhibitor YacG [Acinetobacter baretiae]